MRVAFVIFEGMTALDFIGVYDPVTRLKTMGFMDDLEWDICAFTEKVCDGAGLQFTPTRVRQPLSGYDVLIVPGGFATRELEKDQPFTDWLGTAQPVPLKVSVCTGAKLLGAAGFLTGHRATTHHDAFDALRAYCTVVTDRRVVDDGDVITAGGVTSGIDLGLYLVDKWAGPSVKEKIARQMEYVPNLKSTMAIVQG
ncbi:MAG: DJ-1/PfpI family protein [Anaerolineae bacterium]